MNSLIKTLGIMLAVMLLIIASSAISCTQAIKGQVRIGYLVGDLHQLPFFVSQQKGFFKDEGIDVKVAGPFNAGTPEMDALAANQLDMGYVGVAPAVIASARKVDLSIVAGVNTEGSALIVDKSINNISDLRGKKIATPSPGSVQYVMLGMLLAANNMTFNDLQILPGTINPPDMAGALVTGNINGYIVWEPYASQGIVNGAGKALVGSKDIWPGHPCCTVVTRKDFAGANPAIVAGVVKANQRAIKYIQENPEEAKSLAESFTKLNAQVIENAIPRVIYNSTINVNGIKTFAEQMISLGESGAMKPIISRQDIPDMDAFLNKTIDSSFLTK